MNGRRPFPIPVAVIGPGSQGEEAPAYLPLPQGMNTFAMPQLPEDTTPGGRAS